jgi:autonomous glycyl radical cofactor GrcA
MDKVKVEVEVEVNVNVLRRERSEESAIGRFREVVYSLHSFHIERS